MVLALSSDGVMYSAYFSSGAIAFAIIALLIFPLKRKESGMVGWNFLLIFALIASIVAIFISFAKDFEVGIFVGSAFAVVIGLVVLAQTFNCLVFIFYFDKN